MRASSLNDAMSPPPISMPWPPTIPSGSCIPPAIMESPIRLPSNWRTSLGPQPTPPPAPSTGRSEEHTSELQSRLHLVCRLLLEKKQTLLGRPHRSPAAAPPGPALRSAPPVALPGLVEASLRDALRALGRLAPAPSSLVPAEEIR